MDIFYNTPLLPLIEDGTADLDCRSYIIWPRRFGAIGQGNTVSSEWEAPQGLPANKSSQILFSAWIDLSVLSTMCKLIDNPQMENKVHLYCYCTAASSCNLLRILSPLHIPHRTFLPCRSFHSFASSSSRNSSSSDLVNI